MGAGPQMPLRRVSFCWTGSVFETVYYQRMIATDGKEFCQGLNVRS